MGAPLISVVMIVKDEEDRLAECLESLRNLAPIPYEVCIYDTGSQDRSVAIANSFDARVEHGYWDEDFSRARNAAAAMSSGKWLFVVDADESITVSPNALEEFLRQANETPDAFYVSAEVDASQATGDTSWLSPRIYLPERMRYDRPVHASLIRHDKALPNYWTIPQSILKLNNNGFDTQRKIRSLALKDRLTTKIIETTPEGHLDPWALTDRGRARLGQGRVEEAITDLLKAESIPFETRTTYQAWTKELLIQALLQANRVEESLPILDRLEELQAGRAYTQWIRGCVLAAQRKHAEALRCFSALDGGIDGGLSPLPPEKIYQACLSAAIETQEVDYIIASLIAMYSLKENASEYGPLLSKWWGDLPVTHLREALAISADRPLESIIAELSSSTDTASQILSNRMSGNAL